ncbi:beta-galactoside alpha-2,6-sialyltransferase 2 [Daktulosphaira vitifoliae]|uniref:beta-galactoside alpha-2,6-sialyltransferase 2 n=1 Tax=Daktulosphaira vitifoliae TaxID=58002 RepID=UPI0021A9D460|nr:beta-galactoside alpha-2,6-sialyltransferase 2 [Daktulosphaira vitifoliae]
MRSVALMVWFFLNVVLLGMCGYIYLLWLQYWRHISVKNRQIRDMTYTRQPYVEYYDEGDLTVNPMLKGKKSIMHMDEEELDESNIIRLTNFKNKIITRLRQVVMKENNGYLKGENPYNVPYKPQASKIINKNWVCDMLSSLDTFRTLERSDLDHPLMDYLSEVPLFDDSEIYDSCAIVSNAATLRNSNFGHFIDKHDLVLRFNNAPTKGYEKDVGSKTTIRILNSQVVSKPNFKFLSSPLYKQLKLLMWDPSNYSSSVNEWIQNPEHDFVNNYMTYRKTYPSSNFHIVHPHYLWFLWDFLQSHTTAHIRRNPPSSGFLGLAMLLPRCTVVNMFEFIPSERLTHRCHYYHEKVDDTCTFGIWHPLAAEKLLMLAANTMPDQTVFHTGFVSIEGYKSLQCNL